MIERAARAYVRGVQESFNDGIPDYSSSEWKKFEDQNWRGEIVAIRAALEAALSGS